MPLKGHCMNKYHPFLLLLIFLYSCAIAEHPSSQSSVIGQDDQYIKYIDGTVLDQNTGLMWGAEDEGVLNFQGARKYCSDLRLAGYNDWRLPTMKELQSLYIQEKGSLNKGFITQLISVNGWIWSSDYRKEDYCLKVATFNFSYGFPQWICEGPTFRYGRVLPVRKIDS